VNHGDRFSNSFLADRTILRKTMLDDELQSSQQNTAGRYEPATPISNFVTEQVIALLEERLVVDLTRRKIGDIVVRKEIETHLLQVQVPMRREKLIVEQVSPEYQRLAEIDLGTQVNDRSISEEIARNFGVSDLDSSSERLHSPAVVVELAGTDRSLHGQTSSPQAARDLLNELANLPDGDWEQLKIEIVLKDSAHQDNYQAVLDRYC
jgi:Domain of unknown function (DUF2382)